MGNNQSAIRHPPSAIFRRHYAIPAEHGAWAMLFGPFAVGLGLAWRLEWAVLWAFLGALLLFLARQPMIILVKAWSGRRSREDVSPALAWLLIYGALGLVPLSILIASDYAALLWLALPALPPLAWQLGLVIGRAERQMAVELAGSGALALAAPAAYFAATGRFDFIALSAWLLCWFQSAAAIVYVYVRLEQRRLTTMPSRSLQWTMGRRAVLYHAFNFVVSLLLAALRILPLLVPLAFAAMLVEALRGTFRPALGVKPQILGVSQVVAIAVFVILLVLAYRTA